MKTSRREFLRLGGLTLALGTTGASASDSAAFEFIVFNDTHYLEEGCRAWHREAAKLMTQSAPEAVFLLHAGDVADLGEAAAYTAMREIYHSDKRPLYTVPGNHDWISQTDRSGYRAVFPGRENYAIQHGGWQFLALDTTQGVLYDSTEISAETLAWVEQQAKTLNPAKPTFAFTHFPLGEGTEMRPLNADALVERLARFNLRWVHCGHWHGESVRPSKGIPLSTSRCCARIRGNRDGSPLKGWHIYRASPDGTLTRRFEALPSSI